jgi:hypothetical protein
MDQRVFTKHHWTDGPAVNSEHVRSEPVRKLALEFRSSGSGGRLDGEFDGRALQPGSRAADQGAVQLHGVEVLTIRLPPR